jgi:hypothetical protein
MGRRITVPSAGDQTGQSHAETSLTDHLVVEIHRSFIPVVAACTPALVDPMFCDLDCWRRGDIDDLAAARQTQAAQTQLTLGAGDQPMLHNLGGHGAWPPSIMSRVTLFACLLLFLWRFLLIRFHESWRRFQLLQFLNARLGDSQLLGDFIEPL